MYIDIDVSEAMGGIETAISQLNVLLSKFAALGVSLDQVRLLATGGRGFHVEIHTAGFCPGRSPSPDLPAIYKKLAESPYLYVDGVDLAVYSARKGRMWRVPNRPRESGKFKVPVSARQVQCMTVADYARLTSCPQPWPRLQGPTYAPGLAVEFANATDTVVARTKSRTKASAESAALKARFGGKMPPSAAGLLAGKFQSESGWNRICLQVAALANAVGISEGDLIEQARPLINIHRGDGGRYASVAAREAELRHQFIYAQQSGYQFSVGGLKSIFPRGINTSDLRGLA
jgi:hypothetical protein